MKVVNIFIFILVSCICFKNTYAETNITIQASGESFDISQLVDVRVDIESDESIVNEIKIPGIENFTIAGQSSQESSFSVNGNQTSRISLLLKLKGNKAGKYILGPITLSDDIVSNTLNIEITGAEVFVGGIIDTPPSNQDQMSEAGIEEEISLLNKEILEAHDARSQKDQIFDLQKNSSIFPFHWFHTFLYIIIILALWCSWKIYMHVSQKIKEAQERLVLSQPKPLEYSDYQGLLSEIGKKYIDAPKNIFYGEIAVVMRLYLDEKISPGLSSKTLSEIRETLRLSPQIFSLYEQIYYPEYNTENDIISERQNLLKQLQNELI